MNVIATNVDLEKEIREEKIANEIVRIVTEEIKMTEPHTGEDKNHYISRCIKYVLNDGSAKSQEQAIAMCESKWSKNRK